MRGIARDQGSDLGILSYGNIICGTPRKETKQLLDTSSTRVTGGRRTPGVRRTGIESGSFDKIKAMQERFISGYGGYPLIGTPEQIVDQLLELEQAGVGGMMVGFLDYVQELEYFGERVLPLMREAGLRQ